MLFPGKCGKWDLVWRTIEGFQWILVNGFKAQEAGCGTNDVEPQVADFGSMIMVHPENHSTNSVCCDVDS